MSAANVKPKVLFILKQRANGQYGSWSFSPDKKPLPSGLQVSATQMSYALDEMGYETKVVNVVDNNCIDREVHQFKPKYVIIEAFWVVPEKFEILKKLHPTVTWSIRNHSKTDFLSHEGGMVGWALDYIRDGEALACNSVEATRDFKQLAIADGFDPSNVWYLPNYYRAPKPSMTKWQLAWREFVSVIAPWTNKLVLKEEGILNIGCFGAVRPLKNHLQQAVAAIIVANKHSVKLKFWINATRVEGKADSILNSIRKLFERFPQHELVEMPWMSHEEFTANMVNMDLVMQVSNSETFNIVAADTVASGVPVLVSDEIPWMDEELTADPNSVDSMVEQALYILDRSRLIQQKQLTTLNEYAELTKLIWSKKLI